MNRQRNILALGLVLAFASQASAQVTEGVLYVSNTHMSWWGGVARDAIARQYDVDANVTVLDKKIGKITFQAKKGKLVDLDKLHESIWATRLGDNTGMALHRMEVKAIGEVVRAGKEIQLKVSGTDQYFILIEHPMLKAGAKTGFQQLCEALERGEKITSVSGELANWVGNLTKFSKQLPAKPRTIQVQSFETAK